MITEILGKDSEVIATTKKILPLVLKSSLFMTVCSIFVIWFYLSTLGRLDVFTDAIGFSSLLGIVFGFTVVAFSSFCILIFIPSLMLILIVSGYAKSFFNSSSIKQSIIKTAFLNSWSFGFIIIASFCAYNVNQKNKIIFLASSFILILIASYFFTHWELHEKKGNKPIKPRIKIKTSSKIKLSLSITTPAIIQIIPFSILLSKMTFQQQDSDLIQIICVFLLFLSFATISLMPGIQFLTEFKKSRLIRNILLTASLAASGVIILTILVPIIPLMITNMAMSLAGIADWREHQYTIKNEVFLHSMFPGQQWNTRYYADIPDRFFITGITMFSFGDIKLICPTSVRQVQLENMKFNFKNPEENLGKSKDFKSAAMPCFPIDKKDIKQWDIPLSTPIYYEKVRLTTPHSPTDIFQYLKR